MKTISFKEFNKYMEDIINEVTSNNKPIEIVTENGNMVIISKLKWLEIQEMIKG